VSRKPDAVHQGAVALEYVRSPYILVTSHEGAGVNFTLKQIASLYAGEIKSYPDGTPIRLILRPETEFNTRLLKSLSPEIDKAVQKSQSRDGMILAITDQENAEMLERVKGAIGWTTLGQVISEKRSVIPLPIDNITPSLETFASGTYPYYRPFFVVTEAKPTPLAKSFIEFLTSAEGREILSKNGNSVDVIKP